jgi:phytol kinase
MSDYCMLEGISLKKRLVSLWKELFRKSIHLCTAFLPLFLKSYRIPVLIVLFFAGIGYTVAEILRIHGIVVPVISDITAAAARKRDENHFVLGPVTLVAGIISASLLWTPVAAEIGILALAFGDGLASLGGKMLGRVTVPWTNGKTVAGSLTCFTAIFCSTCLVVHNTKVALYIAACGMAIEVLPLKDFDNLLIPVLLGGIVVCLFPQIQSV